ncbi:MAG: hypothetical protein L0271_25655 [Gemmatimonadetes bacterium]|nr:hypothetical protein [Gemmatimonadota bacterium]
MIRLRALLAISTLAGCGYFNALYNAQRSFGDARRAEERGEQPAANAAYIEAIERAASSYRSHPEGRWADDALLLIARARFALGEDTAARAAALRVLEESEDVRVRASAHAHAGAASLRLGDPYRAQVHLDSAIATGERDARDMALLWRARARWTGRDPAWDDLEALRDGYDVLAAEAGLELASRSIVLGDTARLRHITRDLFANAAAARWSDSVASLLDAAAARHGPAFVASVQASIEDGDWPAAQRDHHRLHRLTLVAAAGDTARAIDESLRLADRSAPDASGRARVLAARLQLAGAETIDAAGAVRATLLPAIADADARRLLRTIAAVESLLDRAAGGQPLALFAAAELARAELDARSLARQLFVAYAEIVPDAVWAPKALLAAADLAGVAGANGIAARLTGHDNVYAAALAGRADPVAFAAAEERLARSLEALRLDAFRDADTRDVRIARAAATLDSLKIAALADSARLTCGSLIDSLAIAGIRADSVRAACVRGDSARLSLYMAVDSALFRDTTGILDDTARIRARRRGVRDTLTTGRS